MKLPPGCVLLSPREAAVVEAALRYAVFTADRAALRSGGVPAFVGPAKALLEELADVGHVGHSESPSGGVGGDDVVYVGTTEVADMLGIPRRTAQRRCAAMRSARRGPGGGWLVDLAEVRELAEGRAA